MVKEKWKMHLFYNGIKIKTLKVDEDVEPQKGLYDIRVIGHKEIFNKFIVRIVVKPLTLIKVDKEKKSIYIGVGLERGVDF